MRKNLINFFLLFTIFFMGECTYAGTDIKSKEIICIRNTCFLPSIKISGEEVPIIGAGHVGFLAMDVYTAAFYAEKDGGEDILNVDDADVKKALYIHYHTGIAKENIIKAANKNIKKRFPKAGADLLEKLEKFHMSMKDVKQGDRYYMEYIPGRGTSLYFNDEIACNIEGHDFQKAYFGIWISDKPISKKLRNELLGKDQKNYLS
ncbi:MAG: chalcone isomerase family protein [Candidatus Omnitrophica bacterium]|nr:chalcone isomerase family protein [Candidatus Omnitrophota bacterium]